VRYQSPGQTKEYAVTVAVCGATNPASNCAQHTTSYYKGQTYNGCAANATALNVSSFTCYSYEIENVSYYEPLNTTESFLDSFTSQFSPLKTSSPKSAQNNSKSHRKEPNSTNKSRTESTSIPNLPPKRNLRILTVNCRSIKDKTSELKAIINYTKPDSHRNRILAERGVKSGKNPTTDAIKSSEVFPNNYTAFRNDRGTLGGGVFILIQNHIIATEKPQYITKCELDWSKSILKTPKIY
jgi:hypothetical protein